MAKIVIGQRTANPASPMGCWVAAPGGNAETGAGRMILDSELDHLKLWDNGSMIVQGYGIGSGLYEYDVVTVNFPSLPYRPIVFVSVSRHAGPRNPNNSVSYPPGINYAEGDYNSSNSYENVWVEVENNRFRIGRYWFPNWNLDIWDLWEIREARISWFVFANRFTDLPPGGLSNPDRVLIEGGNNPRFRVSRPGYSVHSADNSHFLIREDRPSMRPALTGSVVVGNATWAAVSLPGFSLPPFVVLKRDDGVCPARDSYFATLNSNYTQMIVHNVRGGTRTISYAVYHPNP